MQCLKTSCFVRFYNPPCKLIWKLDEVFIFEYRTSPDNGHLLYFLNCVSLLNLESKTKSFRLRIKSIFNLNHYFTFQALTNIFFNEIVVREDFSVTKFEISEIFLEDLTRNVEPSMSHAHNLICQIWVKS